MGMNLHTTWRMKTLFWLLEALELHLLLLSWETLFTKTEKKICLPKDILIVWAVKRSNELSLLSMVDSKCICPSFSEKVHLQIQTYITQELEPPLEDGVLSECKSYSFPGINGSSMSGLAGTQNNIWSGIYVISSIIGFLILLGLMEALYITPFNIVCWWFKGLLFVICMITSIVVFGGLVIFLWYHWEERVPNHEKYINDNKKSHLTGCDELEMQTNGSKLNIIMNTKHYGCRPNLREIFNSVSERWGKSEVGVIVSGPPSLQSSVAAECRSQILRRRQNQPIFNFYCHSFDL